MTLVWPVSICTPNLVQIGQDATEIYLFMYFQYGGRPPSWIFRKVRFFGHIDPCMANIYLHTKFGANRSRRDRDILVYVFTIWRPSAILEFGKCETFGPSDPCMSAHQIWCTSVKKWPIYTCLSVSNMAAVRHLGFSDK